MPTFTVLIGSLGRPTLQHSLDSIARQARVPGDQVIISPAISDDDAKEKFPQGFTTLKPYLRLTPQPTR